MRLFFSLVPFGNIKREIVSCLYTEELIEAFCIGWANQFLCSRKDGDIGDASLAISLAIALKALLHLYRKIIADDLGTMLVAQAYQTGSIFYGGIGVIND